MKTKPIISSFAALAALLALSGSARAADRHDHDHRVADHLRHDIVHAIVGGHRYVRPVDHHYQYEGHHDVHHPAPPHYADHRANYNDRGHGGYIQGGHGGGHDYRGGSHDRGGYGHSSGH